MICHHSSSARIISDRPLPASNHGENILGLVGLEVHEYQTLLQRGRERFLQRGLDVLGLVDAHADMAVGFGQLDKVGQGIHVGLGVAAAVEELLPLPHHAHVAVVERDDLDPECGIACRSTVPGCTSGCSTSPVMQATCASGCASCTPMAYGKPTPMVPKPPELIQRRGLSNL